MHELDLNDYLPDFLRNSNNRQTLCPPETFEDFGDTTLLDPLETNQSNAEELTFRGRFMRGKEEEYEATLAAYTEIYKHPSNTHIQNLNECRKYASISREVQTGELKVISSACHDRWCPMCAAEKAAYATEQTEEYIKSLKKPRFLTLTLRHSTATLKDQIEFLQESFRRLRNRAYWKRRVDGGIWFLQCKRGHNSGNWHPHLHILLDGHYLEQGKLSELWQLITCGSLIVDIRTIHDRKAAAEYVARYVARPAILKNMSMPDRVEVIKALHGKRLCGAFGTGKEVSLSRPKNEDSGEWENVGYYDQIVNDSRNNPAAKKILQCYWQNKPLPQSIFELYVKPHKTYTDNQVKRKKPHQFLLDFYGKAG